MKYVAAVIFVALACCSHAFADGVTLPADSPCAAFAPYGLPQTLVIPATPPACRTGYVAQVNAVTQQPDWVQWSLTTERALGGCTARTNPFHHDEKLPSGFPASPADYAKTGYDLGHLSPYEDNAVSAEMGRDSFDVPTNFSPQLPTLNRLEWEQLEQSTRALTMTLGDLIVIDGPIFGPSPATIGAHRIAVPAAFFKVVIAPAEHAAYAFVMTNANHPKGSLVPFLVSIADIERQAGIAIPVPAGIDKTHVALPPEADLPAFAKAKKAACAQ